MGKKSTRERNPYVYYPLSVSQIDTSGTLLKTYYFLGNAPEEVLSAAQELRADNTWSAAAAKTLAAYYGADFHKLLLPKSPHDLNNINLSSSFHTVYGGAVNSFDEFDNMDAPGKDRKSTRLNSSH